MESIVPENDNEIIVSNKAIEAFRKRIAQVKKDEEFLKNKKFHLGDMVIKHGTNVIERMFNIENGKVGKIVGWDYQYDYYRVFYNKANPFIGVKEEELEAFFGTPPFEVLSHDPYNVSSIIVNIS